MTYTNSPLVNYTKLSPNHSGTRTHIIDTITIHCYVGQASVESAGDWFGKSSTQASCNYMIGADGRIGLIVEEKNRSWCTSSNSNDQRAVTIECACDKTHPYAVNDKVYASLINLVADICKRNGIKKLLWEGDKSLIGNVARQNMTVHRWFKNKACPGEYLYTRHGDIANQVNIKLGANETTQAPAQNATNTSFPAVPFTVQVLVSDLNYRSTGSMSGKVKGQTGKGTFTIVEVKNGWGKLKSGVGWIYLENPSYCKIGKTTGSATPATTKPANTFKPYKVQVTASVLNIRKGAGTNYKTNGSIRDKGVYTIVAESTGKGATKWGKLKSGAGWISLDYCKKI
ncbi:MAG: N-acetylmuramoyl-L-alanine amidase [Tyzzerella sp.]|nr:N-acetylmuramoyl-L-alanine amidase [Tyzzerella sp.]